MRDTLRARLGAHGVAVLATAVTLVVRWLLLPWLGYDRPFLTFFPAVLLSAYWGGWGPGLLATLLGTAAGDFFLTDPPGSFKIQGPGEAYALGLFVLGGVLISGLSESLHRSQRRIAASERRYAVTLASIGDAVIATDTQARVTFLNPAAEALTGWPWAEAVGRPLAEVFRIVNEQTRQPVESPAAKVLRSGAVVGLANHTALLARDGRELPIDDSGAPIIDERGAVAGVVLVFRDVSQRRQAEEAEAFRRVNERVELAVRGSNVGVWDNDMPDGDYQHARRHYMNIWEQFGYERPPEGWAGSSAGPPEEGARSGWTDAAAQGPPWQTSALQMHPDDRGRVEEAIRRYLAGETAEYETEMRFRHHDGSYRTMLARGTAVRDATGKPIRFLGTLLDITNLKRAEGALRESEERFRGTFENAAVGITHTDLDGRWLRVNEKLAAILGYTVEEALRLRWQDVTYPDDVPASDAPLTALLRGERRSYSLEKRYVRKDGTVIWGQLDVSLQRDAAGRPAYVIGVIEDISERKRLEQELRQAMEAEAERAWLAEMGRDVGIALSQGDTLRELLQPCAEALVRYLGAAFARVWWLPPGSNVLELQASAGMYTHLDGPHARVPVGRLKIGRIAQERRPVLTNEVQSDPCISDPGWARREGMVAFAGFPLAVKDRLQGVLGMFSRRPLSGAVLQALESVAGVIALGIERKRQEEETRRAMEAAEAANHAKDEFLANVSHEIRTPMNAILGMTELVLETPLTEDQRQCLRTVKSAADNLLSIINALLDFAKIEAGKLELDAADFSLRGAVGDTLRALAVRAHKQGLELIYDVQPDVPDALVGDAGRLRQVLLNLVGNALKFTERGEVVVQVERQSGDGNGSGHGNGGSGGALPVPAPGPAPGPDGAGVCLRFSVRDTGVGIPREQQERIFRAFEQEDSSTTRKYGGTGLGLTIASRLVALMGGRITVESEPGRGSTFAFTAHFGRQPRPPEQLAERPPVLLHELPVLVVDDNATNRHILEEWLRGWQMKPVAVADGVSALAALRHGTACGRPYALVLLDARMPDTDGLALAARIRERAELSATRVILLTSGDRPGDLARLRELRVDAHLLKPVPQDELLATIHRVMSRDDVAAPPASPTGDREQPPAPVPAAAPLRILVAEDNEFNAQLLDQLLGRRGHRVRVASNGREALGLAVAEAFDLLLLDMHMPELDGFQVARALRERERAAGGHLPIIALTARSRPEDRARCLAAGMDDFLAKPIQPADLWAAIDRAQGGRPPAGPAGPGLLAPRVLLATCGGDAALLEKLCQAIRAHLPDHLKAVQGALRDRDAPRLREAAHKLTGTVAVFSTVAGGVASDLEDRAAQGRLEDARPLVEQLEAMAEELLRLAGGLSLDALRGQAPGGVA
jgi:PAS domain S-box-containing protein